MALQYVVLRHEGVVEPHFDLMFETAPGSRLATWRSPAWSLGPETPVTPLPDHRADYLTYEGPVSGNRGRVRRVAAGGHTVLDDGGEIVHLQLDDGTVLRLPRVPNLLADLPTPGNGESFHTLLNAPGFRVERIVSHGHASPEGFWYDQAEDEWVMLAAGAARLRFEGGQPVELTPGSYVHIPARRRHRVDWTDPTQPTVWLAIHVARRGLAVTRTFRDLAAEARRRPLGETFARPM